MPRYLRDYRVDLLVDGKQSSIITYSTENTQNPLHISFNCKFGNGPAEMTLDIFNMSPVSRSLLQSDDIKVRLQVGYRESEKPDVINLQTMFLGTCHTPLMTDVKGGDHQTKLFVTDGYELQELKVNLEAKPDTTHVQVIKDIVNQIVSQSGGMLSADFTELDAMGIKDIYPKGTSLIGVAHQVLEERLRMHNIKFSVVRGVIKIYQDNSTTRTRIHDISLKTGLLDIPKPVVNKATHAFSNPNSTKAFNFKTLANPELIPLEKVRLSHESLESHYDLIIDEVTHSGGYEANQWYSKVRASYKADKDPGKSIAEAKWKQNQENIEYFKLLTNS